MKIREPSNRANYAQGIMKQIQQKSAHIRHTFRDNDIQRVRYKVFLHP